MGIQGPKKTHTSAITIVSLKLAGGQTCLKCSLAPKKQNFHLKVMVLDMDLKGVDTGQIVGLP